MRRIFNKKAVSPLIATVLLILFAIALGAIVMNVGKDYIAKKGVVIEQVRTSSASSGNGCEGASFRIVTIAGQQQLCYNVDNSVIELVAESTGEAVIESLKIYVIGEKTKEPETISCDQPIPEGEAFFFSKKYDAPKLGVLKYVKITPVVNGEVCTNAAKEYHDLLKC